MFKSNVAAKCIKSATNGVKKTGNVVIIIFSNLMTSRFDTGKEQ